jgi:hypothetical protein
LEVLGAAQYFLFDIGIIVGAYFVAQKQKKIGIFLWLAGFTLPKVLMMFFLGSLIANCEFQAITIVIGAVMCTLLAICLIGCRLFLQWTAPLWKKESMFNEKQIHARKKFWKYYINVECITACGAGLALIPLIAAFLPDLTSSETLFNWLIWLMIVAISSIYKIYVKKRCLPILIPS